MRKRKIFGATTAVRLRGINLCAWRDAFIRFSARLESNEGEPH